MDTCGKGVLIAVLSKQTPSISLASISRSGRTGQRSRIFRFTTWSRTSRGATEATRSAGGANWRLIHDGSSTDDHSYNSASTLVFWLANGGEIANLSTPGQPPYSLDPAGFGYPAVCCGPAGGFANSYNTAISLAVGIVPSTTAQYNYVISKNGSEGVQSPDGAPVSQNYKSNEFEYYLQDSWRATSKITITAGVRHSLLQTPYEVNGQQIAPTVNTADWFNRRASDATQGIAYEPLLTYGPSGQARGKTPYYPMAKGNIAPRVAVAYAITPRTSIRAGFGMYYDHFGEELTSSFAQTGSFGLGDECSESSRILHCRQHASIYFDIVDSAA